MNRLLRLAASAALAGAILLSPAACKKKEQAQEEARVEIKAQPVSQQQRARARQEVEQLWSDPRIDAEVKSHKPAPEHMDFYRDLVVLTRYPHRLAGYGAAEALNGQPGSLAAGRYVASRLQAMGIEYVLTQGFPVAQPITTECELAVPGR